MDHPEKERCAGVNPAGTPGTDPDARVAVSISADGQKAFITGYEPPGSGGASLTTELLYRQARASGVTVKLDPTGVRLAVEAAAEGRDPCGMVIARGEPPLPARDAMLKVFGNLSKPVFPGDVFAVLEPAVAPQGGSGVDGRALPPPEGGKGRDITIPSDGGCVFDFDTGSIRAKMYGLALLEEQKLSVRPLLRLSKDRMRVRATIHDRDFRDGAISPIAMRRALDAAGIKVEPLSDAIASAAARAAAEGQPQENVIVAQGVPPQDGEDGRFEPAFKTTLAAGAVDEEGRMDFHERNVVHSVAEGALVGRLLPPGKGRPGLDVFGKILPARDGRPATIKTGENVVASEDGTEFRAAMDGVVIHAGGQISVSELFQVDGDVDFSIGNIRMEKGSVSIKGSIQNGFAVIAPGNIAVGETIGNARVEAGGDVAVRGGILMTKGGKVKAGGLISARYAMGATLEARGDIDIANEITDCTILADGKVIATRGEGVICGGNISSTAGIEANVIGSELGVVTTLVLGLKLAIDEALLAERKSLKGAIAKITSVLGDGEPAEILAQAPEARRKAVAELLKVRISSLRKLQDVDDRIHGAQKLAKTQISACVRARSVIHSGVVVIIAGRVLNVRSPLNYTRIYYDPETDQLATGPFS